MLASSNRLRKTRDISRVHSRGRFSNAENMTAKFVKNGHPGSRIVVVVGKKISKKATVRNRIRRRLAAELNTQWETVPSGYDIVIMVRADISELPTAQVRAHISQLIKRIPSS